MRRMPAVEIAVLLTILSLLPAILITGDTSGDEMRRVAASGHPVLFKPMQPRRLFEALHNLLG